MYEKYRSHSMTSIHPVCPIRPIRAVRTIRAVPNTTNLSTRSNHRLRRPLPMRLTNQHTLVKTLRTRRHINSRVPREKIHRLQGHLQYLTWHDGEILYPGDMVDAKLDENDDILVNNVVVTGGPAAHTGAAARLVCVFSAGEEFVIAVGDGVDCAVGELGTLVVEAVLVAEDGLEGRGHNLVGDGGAVHGVAHAGVLDFEGAVGERSRVVAAGFFEERIRDCVAGSVGVQFGVASGRVGFGVDEAVGVAVDHWVDAEGEDVLVVCRENTRVDNCAKGD